MAKVRINISIEEEFLKDIDNLAKESGVNRSTFITMICLEEKHRRNIRKQREMEYKSYELR